MKNWFLVQFRPNGHRLAERNLKRQGFETFLPLQEVTRRRATRFFNDLRPLFPGYMFVAIDESSAPWRQINSTLGVSRLVMMEKSPKPVPRDLISELIKRCDSGGVLMPSPNLAPGETVEILSGPFSHFVATIESISDEERVWVLLDILGQETQVELNQAQLQVMR
jgi:transcriptional antiterminator RfaH